MIEFRRAKAPLVPLSSLCTHAKAQQAVRVYERRSDFILEAEKAGP